MLEFHRDAGAACTKAIFFSCRERHRTYLGQKVSARANHRLTEIASHSRCSSVRPETQGKEGEICCYLKGVKNLLWGEVDKKREEKFLLPLPLQKSRRGSKFQLSPAAWERRAKTWPTFSTHGIYALPPRAPAHLPLSGLSASVLSKTPFPHPAQIPPPSLSCCMDTCKPHTEASVLLFSPFFSPRFKGNQRQLISDIFLSSCSSLLAGNVPSLSIPNCTKDIKGITTPCSLAPSLLIQSLVDAHWHRRQFRLSWG